MTAGKARRRSAAFVLTLAGLSVAAAAAAQHAPVRGKPFPPVAVVLPGAPNDPAFTTFRHSLAALARRHSFDELARSVTPRGFFWKRDTAGMFNSKRSGAENLASALGLESGTSSAWQRLADFAAAPTASAAAEAPGVICAPGEPKFDQNDFDNLIDATHSNAAEWVYPRIAGVMLYAARRRDSAVIETLGSVFVRILRFETAPANADPLQTSWTRVATPGGKIGYAPPNTLAALNAAQLCYVKDIAGRWIVAGFIGSGP